MSKHSQYVPPMLKCGIDSAIGRSPSEALAKSQKVNQEPFEKLAPVARSGKHSPGGTPSSKSRSKRRPAARAYQYPNRLNNTAINHSKRKRPNAQKHGVFAISPVIPGEDPREFEELHSALIDEWQPSGPIEEDRVFGIADAMWRKLRSQKFLRAKLFANTIDPNQPAFDEGYGLATLCLRLRGEPETPFDKLASSHLRPDKIKYLSQKFPRANYQSTSEWSIAIAEEIETALLPDTPSLKPPEPREKVGYLTEGMRRMTSEGKLFISIIHASDFFEHDLNLREHLDARIARLVKELIQIKAMKQMLHQTSAE
jgi:hypothetical protein